MMRVFAAAGIPSHFQEIKNTLRWKMLGKDLPCALPRTPGKEILLKETLGPYTETECRFNPLQVLLDAGAPRKRIHLLVAGREPLETWASWEALWGKSTRVELFIQSLKTVEEIRREAIRKKIHTTCVTCETFNDHLSETVMKKLFQRLGLTYGVQATQNWDRLPPFGEKGSNIFFPREPEIFDMPRGLEKIRRSTSFSGRFRKRDLSGLKKSDRNKISQSGLDEIYQLWNQACRDKLISPLPGVLT